MITVKNAFYRQDSYFFIRPWLGTLVDACEKAIRGRKDMLNCHCNNVKKSQRKTKCFQCMLLPFAAPRDRNTVCVLNPDNWMEKTTARAELESSTESQLPLNNTTQSTNTTTSKEHSSTTKLPA